MKYNMEELPVLKNLNVIIENGWKVRLQNLISRERIYVYAFAYLHLHRLSFTK